MHGKPLKIGILALAEPSDGGVFQYTQSVIDALSSQKNCDAVVLARTEAYSLSRFPLRKISIPALSLFGKARRAMYLGARLGKRPYVSEHLLATVADLDIIISTSPGLIPYWLGKPFVAIIHDFQDRYFPDFFSRRERIARRLVNRLMGRVAERLLCESSFVKSDMARFAHISPGKIDVIPAPPPQTLKSASSALLGEVRRKYDLGPNFLFYPAQFWPHKNHERALSAFSEVRREFPDLLFVMSGAKKTHFDAVMQHAKKIGVSDGIRYLGYIPYEELSAVYMMSRMLLMPSLFESISIPVYEAFALGVPVCAAQVTALPEQVGDAALLFNPLSVSDMAEKIFQLLRDPGLAKELAQRGRLRVQGVSAYGFGERLMESLSLAYRERGHG